MKLLLTREIKARAMARALPRGTTSSAMQVQIRTMYGSERWRKR